MIVAVNQNNVYDWAALCIELWPDHELEDFLKEWYEKALPYEYIYYLNDTPIAFLSLSIRLDYVEGCNSSPVAYLEGIYVKPNYQRQGIAKVLIDFAKNWALEKGLNELASDCELNNHNSELFHKKVGFKEVNRIICFTMDLNDK